MDIHFVYGHTEAMMLPFIKLPNGKTLVYCADLFPSHHHIPMPYIMAYDLRPLDTMNEKNIVFERVTDGNHFLFFEHDPTVACGNVIVSDHGKATFGEKADLQQILSL